MGRTRTASVVITSALLHLILLTSIMRSPPTLRVPAESAGPVLDVTLVHRQRPRATRLRSAVREPLRVEPAPTVTPRLAPRRAVTPGPTSSTTPLPVPAPLAAAPPKTQANCEPELRLLLTAEERRACDMAAAVASARARKGFNADGPVQDISRVPLERAREFDAEAEAKRTRNARAEAQLAEARAESAKRRAPTWTGQGQGVDATVRVDCTLKFAGLQFGKPKCRFSGSVMP